MENIGSLGKRLKDLREKRGFTQSQLADKVGRNPHTIKDYEADRAMPSMRALELLANALGVSQRDLFDPNVQTQEVVTLSPSQSIKRYLSIPDEIVELAPGFDLDDEVWNIVKSVMKKELEAKLKKQNKKHHA